MSMRPPIPIYNYLNIWPWKSKVKVMVEVNIESEHGSSILLTHIPFVTCQWAISLLRYNFSEILPWKSKVKVMGDVNIESRNMGQTFYQVTSLLFHVNRLSHPLDKTFSKFDLENPRSRSWLRSKLKVTKCVQHPIDWHPFCSMPIGPHITEIQHFQDLALKIKGQGQMTMMLHNYISWQFHRLLNGINPPNSFRDMGSAKSGPSDAWFDKFLAHGQAHMGQIGK